MTHSLWVVLVFKSVSDNVYRQRMAEEQRLFREQLESKQRELDGAQDAMMRDQVQRILTIYLFGDFFTF